MSEQRKPPTDEQLAEIERWARGPSGHYTNQDVVDYAGAAKLIILDLLAEVRRLRQGAAEAYQMACNSDYPVGYADNFLALADGEPLPHEWGVLRKEDYRRRKANEQG